MKQKLLLLSLVLLACSFVIGIFDFFITNPKGETITTLEQRPMTDEQNQKKH
jgi:hypothetical protein